MPIKNHHTTGIVETTLHVVHNEKKTYFLNLSFYPLRHLEHIVLNTLIRQVFTSTGETQWNLSPKYQK